MATQTESKPAPPAKFEAFVEQQLGQVRRRLRAIDVGAASLVLLTITLGYAIASAFFDLVAKGSSESWVTAIRVATFLAYLGAMACGGYVLVARLWRRINPYYCAHELEQTVPGAKNSVINWLDLRQEQIPSAIRTSLGLKAAKDLKQADADRVADPKQTWFLGGLAGLLFAVLVVLFAMSPGQFGSLMARAFLPFRDISVANRATITLVRPTGDATVPQNSRIEFVAQIEGRFPKVNHPHAPTLWYRYAPGEPFVPMPLEEDPFGQWSATMAPDQVRTGFWYKISAGDDETPVYQISVRSLPIATKFEVTYHYRPYRKLADETIVFPNERALFPEIHGHRGTEATIIVHTNQPVRDGFLQVQVGGKLDKVPGERLDDPKAFRSRLTLEQSGQFIVLFRTQEDENNTDLSAYRIDVLDDQAPNVVLTKPAQDVALPANGTLTVEGFAQDDFGVKNLSLYLRVLQGTQKPNLAPQLYRPGKSFQFETGQYPTKIDYLDVVALDKLKMAQGQPFPLSAGMVLEYWLEASDNADYPTAAGNVGRSKAYKITVLDPQKDEKKNQEERKQAQEQQKKHDKQQDQQHQKENKEKKDDANPANDGKSPEQRREERLKQEREDIEKKLKEAEHKKEEQKKQGESKGQEPSKAENKSDDGQPPDTKPKDDKSGKEPQQAGAKKDEGGTGQNSKPAETKSDGKQGPQNAQENQQASQPKDAGKDQKPQPAGKGQEQKAGEEPQQQPSSAKEGPKGNAKQQPGEGKNQGAQQGGMEKSAQAKDGNPKDEKSQPQNAGAKGAQGSKDAPEPQAKKTDRQDPQKQAGKKGDTKPGENQQLAQEKGQGNTKPGGEQSKNPPGADGTRRPADAKGDEKADRKSTAKDGGGKKGPAEQGPPAAAKQEPMNSQGQPQGSAKESPPSEPKESGQAKDDKGQGPPREPTAKDLERLRDQLKNKDPNAQQTAKELENNLPEAKDPQMRKEAEDLLKQAAKLKESQEKNQQPKEANPPMNAAGQEPAPKGMGDPMPMPGQQGGKEKAPMGAKGNEPQKNEPGDKNVGGTEAGGSGPNGQGPRDNLKPSIADKAFERGGDLQLDDLKKRMTPEMRKLIGMSDEEWAQFLKEAQAYEQRRARAQSNSKNEPTQKFGGPSQLQNTGPRQVGGLPQQANPASIGQAQAPPELRDAQRRFTEQKAP